MPSAAQTQLDELLDARQQLRDRRKALEAAKIVLQQARDAHRETKELLEKRFDEIEQRQGRLNFEDAEQTSAETYAPGVPAMRGRKRRDAEWPRA